MFISQSLGNIKVLFKNMLQEMWYFNIFILLITTEVFHISFYACLPLVGFFFFLSSVYAHSLPILLYCGGFFGGGGGI